MSLKRNIITIIILAIYSSVAFAQEWVENFDEAKKMATEKNMNIVLVFSGSDWCAPCIKLNKNILSSPEFVNMAKDHFVLFNADFPRKKKNKLPQEKKNKNKILADMYNTHGFFPLVVVMDKKGEVLGKTGYKKILPKEYFDLLVSLE